ncbi:sugar isomerase [Christensenellaceae bacterium OttesenSCG-928-K19]|nr:sugar isomerase [Christensenellaceae bacterium OttesenSCG-928-K19]
MKRGILNALSGVGSQILIIIFGLMVPQLIMSRFGTDMYGLTNTIIQVFNYFALLEAGVGAATLQALYKPIAQDDKPAISGIMSATQNYYRRTGIVYLLAVIAFAVIYPLLLSGSGIPFGTVFALVMMQGLVGVANYFFQGKFRCFLEAEGKSYVTANLLAVVTILTNVFKVVFLNLGFDIVAVQSTYLIFNLLQMLILGIYMRRHYNWINLKAKPDFGAISKKNSAMVHQVASLVFNSTDLLILNAFCGLAISGVYSTYMLVFSMVTTILRTISTSVSFALGQALQTSKKAHDAMHDCFEVYYSVLAFTAVCVVYIFIPHFIKLYTVNITDVNFASTQFQYLPLLFMIMSLLDNSRPPYVNLITYAGHFKETQVHAIIESVINLSVSLVCVNFWGIYGVLIGTIAALVYRTNQMMIYANKKIKGTSPATSYRRWGVNIGLFIVVVFVSSNFTLNIQNYWDIILWALLYLVIIGSIFFLVDSLANRAAFRFLKQSFKPVLKKLLNR